MWTSLWSASSSEWISYYRKRGDRAAVVWTTPSKTCRVATVRKVTHLDAFCTSSLYKFKFRHSCLICSTGMRFHHHVFIYWKTQGSGYIYCMLVYIFCVCVWPWKAEEKRRAFWINPGSLSQDSLSSEPTPPSSSAPPYSSSSPALSSSARPPAPRQENCTFLF